MYLSTTERINMQEKQQNGNMKIEVYNLADFLQALQEEVLNGYRLNLEVNECYPQNFGSMYSVVLVPEKTKALPALLKPKVQPEDEPEQEPTPSAKRGRPKAQ
jgi:hypothetical protein